MALGAVCPTAKELEFEEFSLASAGQKQPLLPTERFLSNALSSGLHSKKVRSNAFCRSLPQCTELYRLTLGDLRAPLSNDFDSKKNLFANEGESCVPLSCDQNYIRAREGDSFVYGSVCAAHCAIAAARLLYRQVYRYSAVIECLSYGFISLYRTPASAFSWRTVRDR